MISWRWKVLLERAVCSWRGHRWHAYEGLHATDGSGWRCGRCLADRPSQRIRYEDATRTAYTEYLDVNGRVVGSEWLAGPAWTPREPEERRAMFEEIRRLRAEALGRRP